EDFQLIRQAILFENEELLVDLISASPFTLDARDESGRSPLMLAAHNGKLKALQILVNMAPESIDYRSPVSGKTALHLCCEGGDINAVSILLEAGADPSILDSKGYCALEVAHMCTGDNSSLTRMLIDAIQSEESRLESLHANLLMATANGEIERMTEILAGEKNREKIMNGKNGKGALMVACQNGRLEGVEFLLEEPFRSVNLLLEESSGDSILHAAISSQNILLVRFILENYPTLASKCNKEGSSVLHWAVRSQNVDIVELLLDFPYPEYAMIEVDNHSVNYRFAFDLNSGDCECRTALYLAVLQSDVNTLTSLLAFTLPMGDSIRKCPFLVDVYCMKGRTPLMVAARNNHLQLISVLLSHGADISLPCPWPEPSVVDEGGSRAVGSGALLEAARGDCIDTAQLLIEKGAVDTSNRALRMAVRRKNETIVLLLLSRLAFPDNEMRVNKRNVEVGQMQIGESLLPSYVCPSKGVIVNWSSASLSFLLPQWISAAAMHINTRMRTSTFAFAAITRMDLSNNKLSAFPPLLFQLPSIRSISLSYNEISTIEVPPGYLYSSTIETLILSNNSITSIPSALLILLPSLTTLDISNNDLSSLPDSIWMSPSLKELNASGNHLTSLPTAHSTLSSVHREEGRSGEESSLDTKPRPIHRRSHWQNELSLSVVEEEGEGGDGSSHTLTSLDFSHNEFRMFPTSLACICPRLTRLSMAHNLLTALCSISALPPSLRSLDVSYNSLTCIFSSSSTEWMECEGGLSGRHGRRNSPGRQCRSRSKSAVRSQRALSVSRNGEGGGKGECPHRRHSALVLLKTLNLTSNRLKTILLCRGEIVLTPALTNLDVSSNEIAELDGVSLSRLSHLAVLSLSSNPLSTLPPQLGLLSHLWSLNLKDCPLVDPILSIVSNENAKTVEVVSMLRCVLEESKTFAHLKLFILGQTGVGKSTIADAIKSYGHGVKGITQGRCARVFQSKSTAKIISSTVTFSVWDCCGEMEVRPLLEYSFCRRGLYLVLFRVTEGRESIHSLTSYLLSIHARAPGASVILVGTHADQLIGKSAECSLLSDLESWLRHRFLSGDGESQGLPRILDVLFVSLKKKDDIRRVLRCVERGAEGSRIGKEVALTQRIPLSHICLLNALQDMTEEMKKNGKEAIIPQSSLLKSSKGYMKKKIGRSLRDENELSLAVSFVRECGLVLRVGESSSRPLIVLDPLSFLDNLSLILSIRSVNRPAGILPLSSFFSSKEFSSLGLHLLPLLHKCSLALSCHSNLFLLPSLLPDEFSLRADVNCTPIQMEARIPSSNILPITKINWSHRNMNLVRFYSMVYVPNGFWPRLISRLTWDENITKVMGQLVKMEDLKWNLWQNGTELMKGKDRLFVVKEFFPCADPNEINLASINWRMRVEGNGGDIDISYNQSIVVYIPMVESEEKEECRLWTKIVSLIVDIIDYLLEDWYPTVGTRFVHSSQGDPLVRRIVVCPSCSPFHSPPRRSRDDSDAPTQERSGGENGERMKSRSKTMSELCSLHSSLHSVSTFSIEECMQAAMIHNKNVECPIHGIINLRCIAPDCIFLDIEPSLRIEEEAIKRGRLIGRGAFGFVFRAHVKTMNSLQPYEVAQKMLEPCDPGSAARVSAVNEYKAVESKWERDPLEYSTRAYLSCRQEVGLLTRLSHPNTLSLMGMTCSPLSIVVEMAPLGSLRSLLTSFRKSQAKLSIRTLTDSSIQVAKALEYLHSNNIVYRDLKSENVLVWRFPPPFCTGEVELKVGDYGISRQGLPSGEIKGFGGTEGFMAPEIVKWNGEEEYSLKVDVFSFGMFLYELMTLKQPFENEDHVKEKIVNGGRPLLMPSELLWPCSLLDVLTSCWNSSAISRPSSSQLVSLLCAPELSHLIDTAILPSLPLHIMQRPVSASDDEDDDAHIWVIFQSTIDIYSCTMFGWVECTSISMDSSWSNGRLYSRESSDWMWRVGESNELSLLPFNLSNSICVSTPQLDSHPLISTPIAVSSSLFILPSKFSLHLLTRGDDSLSSFNLIESLTSPFEILSFALLNHHSNRQIWTGHEEGIITAHFISSDDKFSFSSSFSHPESLPVARLLSSKDGTTMWSYLEGSSRIFCWDVLKRNLNSQLDTRKVQPASETIHTLETDCSSRISSLCVLESGSSSLLFVGTVEGSLLVLSAHSLQPLSACRPYSHHLSTLIIVDCRNEEETQPGSRTNSSEGASAIRWMREQVDRLRPSSTPMLNQSNHLLLTIGRGFRSLIDRFVSQEKAKDDIVAALWKIDDWFN
ncbi:hypothetical protein PMAYCL1PPCAC_23862, partial [Pristionchus mayeri]